MKKVMRVSRHYSLALDVVQELERLASESGESETSVIEALVRARGLIGKPVADVQVYTTTGNVRRPIPQFAGNVKSEPSPRQLGDCPHCHEPLDVSMEAWVDAGGFAVHQGCAEAAIAAARGGGPIVGQLDPEVEQGDCTACGFSGGDHECPADIQANLDAMDAEQATRRFGGPAEWPQALAQAVALGLGADAEQAAEDARKDDEFENEQELDAAFCIECAAMPGDPHNSLCSQAKAKREVKRAARKTRKARMPGLRARPVQRKVERDHTVGTLLRAQRERKADKASGTVAFLSAAQARKAGVPVSCSHGKSFNTDGWAGDGCCLPGARESERPTESVKGALPAKPHPSDLPSDNPVACVHPTRSRKGRLCTACGVHLTGMSPEIAKIVEQSIGPTPTLDATGPEVSSGRGKVAFQSFPKPSKRGGK